ncbi:MAG: Lrp/AsnC family transcriptional regulator [Paracoccaceae bacterium]
MSNIDHIDEHILRELERDGRISNLALSDRVGLSASACLRRVAALERSGIIQGYRAVVDRKKRARGFLAYIGVGLNDHSRDAQWSFEKSMAQADPVRECHNITGTIEYLLRIECADLDAYKAFHTDLLGALSQVNAITTYVVIGSPKDMRT